MSKNVEKPTAILLKEKGFDLLASDYYTTKEGTKKHIGAYFNHNQYDSAISAPTLLEVAEWLREVKGVYAFPIPAFQKEDWGYQLFVKNKVTNCWDLSQYKKTGFKSFDEALEEAIIHTLMQVIV